MMIANLIIFAATLIHDIQIESNFFSFSFKFFALRNLLSNLFLSKLRKILLQKTKKTMFTNLINKLSVAEALSQQNYIFALIAAPSKLFYLLV